MTEEKIPCIYGDASINIAPAIEQYRADHNWGDPSWISIEHPGYPLGIDVQIELDDDETAETCDQLLAWVYANHQPPGSAYLVTDTQNTLACFGPIRQ